ncbi:MAG: hypothetical protein V1875_00685 [Candidatus Altiarchaeota archaeon]
MSKKTRGRGAVFTMDLIAALFIFLVIIVSMMWLWGTAYARMDAYRDSSSRQSRLLDISSALVKTPGNPADWQNGQVTPDRVYALGLASAENVLSEEKLTALESANYQSLREIMGLGSENFSITVSRDYGGTPEVLYSKGAVLDASERRIVRRYALMNGTRVELKLEAYYEKR